MKRIKIWYHTTMQSIYGNLADSIEEDPVTGMTHEAEWDYLKYFRKFIYHKAKVRELQKD